MLLYCPIKELKATECERLALKWVILGTCVNVYLQVHFGHPTPAQPASYLGVRLLAEKRTKGRCQMKD